MSKQISEQEQQQIESIHSNSNRSIKITNYGMGRFNTISCQNNDINKNDNNNNLIDINDDQPTFQSNISQLMLIKQQLLQLYSEYSPNSKPNIHHTKQISILKQQVNQSKQRIIEFQSMIQNSQDHIKDKLHQLQREKEQLIEINEKFLGNSEQLANKVEMLREQKEQMNKEYQLLMRQVQNDRKKHKKQIDNIKLMHAQEIYMLKKKLQQQQLNNSKQQQKAFIIKYTNHN